MMSASAGEGSSTTATFRRGALMSSDQLPRTTHITRLRDEPPRERPGPVERVDEPLVLDHLEYLTRHRAPAGHVEVEPVTHSRGDVPGRPPTGEQLRLGDDLPHPGGINVDELVDLDAARSS